ncbi:MAG: SnoaL-like domain-containing protein, partial [Ginsengibacter sp.]
MSTKEVADKLVQYCRKGDFNGAQAKLYADDAVSIEPQATPEFEKETKELDAIKKKSEKFDSMVDSS